MNYKYSVEILWCDEDNEWFWARECRYINIFEAVYGLYKLRKKYPNEQYRLARYKEEAEHD